MLDFISLLKQRYQRVLAHCQTGFADEETYQAHVAQLSLARALLIKQRWIENTPQHCAQIVVIGPTQSGKSTLVNSLVQQPVAGVSPLAGYTVHPQGFVLNDHIPDTNIIKTIFEDFMLVPVNSLDRGNYRQFSLEICPRTADCPLPACIIWDTPDFDSIDASAYREGVLATIALADWVVLVVSKEKYADQSVWDLLQLLEPLAQPTLVILNKLNADNQALIVESFQRQWRDRRRDEPPPIVPMTYQKQSTLELPYRVFQLLRRSPPRARHYSHTQQFIAQHWSQWLVPVIAEHANIQAWQQLATQIVEEALANYRRDYLDHPRHNATFQRAMLELLTLLEIPGIARVLAEARRVLTWPLRQIFSKKSSIWSGSLAESSQELMLLQQIVEHALIQLSDRLLEKLEQEPDKRQWWKTLIIGLRQQRPLWLAHFNQAAAHYHVTFQTEIENTAALLHQKLQEQPLVLNGLRATRVTTDAAVVALTLKTGGISWHDLVVAPAVLSLTSYLAESALGSYLHRAEATLKQRQWQTVKEHLFEHCLLSDFLALPQYALSDTLFAITPEQLLAAERQLNEKRHGLRLFSSS